MSERLYWLGFSFFHGIGPVKFKLLLEKFWTAENAWNATELELHHSGIGEKVAQNFLHFRKTFDLEKYAEQLEKGNVSYIIQSDPTYPSLLSQIKSPPFVLYIKGEKEILKQSQDDPLSHKASEGQSKFIAVVGTRKVTEYGRQITQMLTEELASAGCVIVSGLAMGVDAIAHAAALDVNGKTIAVLGCGVDCCTPRENERLYQQIIEEGGAVISEAPLGHMSFVGSFPSRNRIIAGLSLGVLVTEGAEDSGSLITANNALEANRKVFAVPGPITSTVSRGPISLIAKGAKMVTAAKDIFDELDMKSIRRKSSKTIKGDTSEEQKILDLLQNEHLRFDELVKRTGLHSSQIGTILSLMEMKGFIKTADEGVFILTIE